MSFPLDILCRTPVSGQGLLPRGGGRFDQGAGVDRAVVPEGPLGVVRKR